MGVFGLQTDEQDDLASKYTSNSVFHHSQDSLQYQSSPHTKMTHERERERERRSRRERGDRETRVTKSRGEEIVEKTTSIEGEEEISNENQKETKPSSQVAASKEL